MSDVLFETIEGTIVFEQEPTDIVFTIGTGIGGAGGAGHVIQDEGIDLPEQPSLNFTGSGVIAQDDPANNATKVIISGSGGSVLWGDIGGTIPNQADLQGELDGKEPVFAKNTAFNKAFGTAVSTVTEGDDARLSDTRDPNAHDNAAHSTDYTPQTTYDSHVANYDLHLTASQNNAIDAANNPAGSNPLATIDDLTPKADKVSPVVAGNFAGLDVSGNITDSGEDGSSWEPVFAKNTGFNLDIGSVPGTVCGGSDSRLSDSRVPMIHGNEAHTPSMATQSDLTIHIDNGIPHLSNDERLAFINTPTLATGANPIATQADLGDDGHEIEDEGVGVPNRVALNFVGPGVTVSDNMLADSTDVTITRGYEEIQNSGVVLPEEHKLNFINGLQAADDGGATRTSASPVYGTNANTVTQGNDARLSDARDPNAHAASHASGQSDAISHTILEDIGTLTHTQLETEVNGKLGAVVEDLDPHLGSALVSNGNDIQLTDGVGALEALLKTLSTGLGAALGYTSDGIYNQADGAVEVIPSSVILGGSTTEVVGLKGTGNRAVQVNAEGILYATALPDPTWFDADTDTGDYPLPTLGTWVELTGLVVTVAEDTPTGDLIGLHANLHITNVSNQSGFVDIGFGIGVGIQPVSAENNVYISARANIVVATNFTTSTHPGYTAGQQISCWAMRQSEANGTFNPEIHGSTGVDLEFIIGATSASDGGGGGSPTNLGNIPGASTVTVTSSTGSGTVLAGAISGTAGVMTGVQVDTLTTAMQPAIYDTSDNGVVDKAEAVYGRVRKGSVGTINMGQPVYISGWNPSGFLEVEVADADDPAKMPAIGVAAEAITIATLSGVVIGGLLEGFDTSLWGVNDSVYVSEAEGELTNIKPTGATSGIQKLGKILRSHASQGAMEVIGAGRTNDTPNITEGNIWVGDSNNHITEVALPTGDVVGPGAAVDTGVTIYDGVTGKLVKDSALPIANVIATSVAAQYVLVAEKVAPVSADKLLVEDSEAAGAKKYVAITNLPAGAPNLTDATFPTYAAFSSGTGGWVVNAGTSPTVNLSLGNNQIVTNAVVGAISITGPAGVVIHGTIVITNPDTITGVTVPGIVEWVGGAVPTWTTTGGKDLLSVIFDGTNAIIGVSLDIGPA